MSMEQHLSRCIRTVLRDELDLVGARSHRVGHPDIQFRSVIVLIRPGFDRADSLQPGRKSLIEADVGSFLAVVVNVLFTSLMACDRLRERVKQDWFPDRKVG